MRTLYGLTISPYTEKARWALDHHGVSYTYHEHVPLLGEVLLRRKAKKAKATGQGKASVPLLADDDEVFMPSSAIARHADAIGSGSPLFPRGKEDEVLGWGDVSDAIIDGGRSAVMRGLIEDRAAQRENVPSFVPGFAKGLMAPSVAMATKFLSGKHAVPVDPEEASERLMRPALEKVRAALGGKTYLVGDAFSFADVAIGAALQAVRPREATAFGPATRAIWTNAKLASDFEDLLLWRDALYAKHR